MRNATAMACVLGMVGLTGAAFWGCSGSTAKKNPMPDMAMTPGGDMSLNPPVDMAMSSGGFSCSTGTLYAGAPVSAGAPGDQAASDTPIIGDPPVHWETLVFSSNDLYTRHEGEVWWVDTSAASPHQKRIAGITAAGSIYDYSGPSPCASATFTELFGLGALPDGSLVASDLWGNAVLKIANPTNAATCTVTVLAGNASPTPGIDPSDATTLPPQGNADGVGSAATFNVLGALTVDSAGNVYVTDRQAVTKGAVTAGTILIRKIATASGNTVTTLPLDKAKFARVLNMTTIGTSLYVVGDDGNNTSIVAQINTTTGAATTIKSGFNQDAWPPESGLSPPDISGITNDGTNLIISGGGFVWYLTLSGTLTAIAGSAPPILNADFPGSGYDPNASHPALSLELVSDRTAEQTKGSFDHIAYHGGAVYYRGDSQGDGFFVEKIACH